jgi:hypothetical protein
VGGAALGAWVRIAVTSGKCEGSSNLDFANVVVDIAIRNINEMYFKDTTSPIFYLRCLSWKNYRAETTLLL